LDTLATATAAANVDVELADDGTARNLRLELLGNLELADGAAAVRASVGQGGVERFVDAIRSGCRAVTVAAVGRTGFTARLVGLSLGWPFGEGSGLPFRLTARLFEISLRLFQFALEVIVLVAEAFIFVQKNCDTMAEIVELAQERDWNRHGLGNLDL